VTVEIRPFGTRCNIQCRYCYQEPRREAGLLAKSFDIVVMLPLPMTAQLAETNSPLQIIASVILIAVGLQSRRKQSHFKVKI